MPKEIPTLGAVAKAQADEKTKTKLAGALSAIAGALGLGGNKPAAKMTKRTLTTKRTETEESDTGAEGEEEGSGADAEEGTGSETDVSETSDDSAATGTGSAAEEEEGETEEDGKAAKYEEEEESKALARAVSKALNSPAVHQAFLAALPKRHRDAGALFSPHRLASSAKRATGATTTYAAMHALADLKQRAKGSAEAVLKKQATLEKRVAKVEGARRSDRVNAIVDVAKERGVPGATTKQGREMLRDYGMQHGTKALSAFIQSQGDGLRRVPKTPREIPGATGAPSAADQERMMEAAMNGLDAKGREQFMAVYEENKKKAALNGAGKAV